MCGVAPYLHQDGLLVLLTVPKTATFASGRADGDNKTKNNKAAPRPQVQVVEPLDEEGEYNEISTDLLSLRGHSSYLPSDYHLSCLCDESHFLVCCPKDLVAARPRDPDDRLQWLLDRERYAEALQAAEKHGKVKV